jgi:hypothetical protein
LAAAPATIFFVRMACLLRMVLQCPLAVGPEL